jgi:predicted dienelactone hydrolase
MDSSAIMAGIASWGFVVAAPQHIERDRAALVSNAVTRDPERDVQVLVDTVELVGAATGPLEGLANTEQVGAIGHSAGGRAALTALSEPEIDVAVGWAAAGRGDVEVAEKPSMNIAATVDVLIPLSEIEATQAALAPPKRLVVIDGAGHNSFTDTCAAVRKGNDLIGIAQSIGFAIPESLAAGATDHPALHRGAAAQRARRRRRARRPRPRRRRRVRRPDRLPHRARLSTSDASASSADAKMHLCGPRSTSRNSSIAQPRLEQP